jgi:hypothetical protein
MAATVRALFIVAVLICLGCETESVDPGPSVVCVLAAGVWEVSMVPESGTGISCPDRIATWTLNQSGCDVSIQAESWDPANGAVGSISADRLSVEWIWFERCYRYDESIDVTIEGDTMTGTYYMFRGQAVYPAYCPGLGVCSATVNGVRRAG